MSLAYDENGRPFIILREQDQKKRVKGLEAHKVSYQPKEPIFHYLIFQNVLEKAMECSLISALILITFVY
jgi:hypothetical protein